MKVLCAAFTIFLWCATFASAQNAQPFCKLNSFSLAPANVQASITEFGWSTDKDRTQAHLVLHNDSPTRTITSVLILAEAVDGTGQHISTIPLYAAINKELKQGGSFNSAGATVMQSSLLPGESLSIGATITETTARCPTNIRPALVEVVFSDGATFHYSQNAWQMEPSLGKVNQLDLSSFPGEVPLQELVEVTVDSKRRVTGVKCQTDNPQVASWFEKQLSNWAIFPEVRNGNAVTSKVKLLFRFHRRFNKQDATEFDQGALQSSSVIPIDVFPKNGPRSLNQAIFAGGLLLVPAQ